MSLVCYFLISAPKTLLQLGAVHAALIHACGHFLGSFEAVMPLAIAPARSGGSAGGLLTETAEAEMSDRTSAAPFSKDEPDSPAGCAEAAGNVTSKNPAAAADIAALFEQHADYLFRYAFQHFRNEEVAKDLVQETFLAVSRAHHTFKGNSAVRTWLTSILRHKLIDHVRKKSTSSETSLTALEERGLEKFFDQNEHWTEAGPREWVRDPHRALEQTEFMAITKDCLGQLPERFRQIFLLKEWDGLSRDEISTELGVTSNNVGVILHRARLYLRECIGSKWSAA